MFHDMLRSPPTFPNVLAVLDADYQLTTLLPTTAMIQFTAISTLLLGYGIKYERGPVSVFDTLVTNRVSPTSDDQSLLVLDKSTSSLAKAIPSISAIFPTTKERVTTSETSARIKDKFVITPKLPQVRLKKLSTSKTIKVRSTRPYRYKKVTTSHSMGMKEFTHFMSRKEHTPVNYPPYYIRVKYYPTIGTAAHPNAYINIQLPTAGKYSIDRNDIVLLTTEPVTMTSKETTIIDSIFMGFATGEPVSFDGGAPSSEELYVAIIATIVGIILITGNNNLRKFGILLYEKYSHFFYLVLVALVAYKRCLHVSGLNDVELVSKVFIPYYYYLL